MPRIRVAFFVISILTLCNLEPEFATAQSDPTVEYVVDLSDARNHYITVEMTVPAQGPTTEVMMAVWTPGSYLVREYARHVDSVTATAEGERLSIKKMRKNRWQVDTEDHARCRIKYRVYCNELSVRTNFVSGEYAVLNGAPTFMTVAELRNCPHHVRLRMPRKWTRSATSLKSHEEQANAYLAESFDELVDSPIVAGNVQIYPFTVADVPHQLVNVGESGYWNGTKAAADLARVVAAHHEMWGNVPYDRYLFLNVIGERGGGLEHDNSCLMMTSRWTYRNEDRYRSWLSLASHEFFHTWNVRRLRPRSLVEYDYENEVYTRSLWIAEGITSYYEDLLLVRAGVFTEQEFLRRLSSSIQSVQRTHGRRLQSLTESSYDSWIKFYRSDENSSNTRISYYSKGAVVAMLLDAEIRAATDNEKSLDDVMRIMYEKYVPHGYLPEDFRKVASDVAQKDLNEWFRSAVDATEELDYRSMLSHYGLNLPAVRNDGDQTDSGQKLENQNQKREKNGGERWLGFSGSTTVSRVEADSPATEAGLNTGDEIIGINGFRVSGSVNERIKQYEIGDEIEMLISRRGKLMNMQLTIGSRERQSWSLKVDAKASENQKRAKAHWLGQEYAVPEQEETGEGVRGEPAEREDDRARLRPNENP